MASRRIGCRPAKVAVALAPLGALAVCSVLAGGGAGEATPTPVGLGTATSFAVLGGSTVTNTGPSLINGDLGFSPGTAITGFPPGLVAGGSVHDADSVASSAQAVVTTAYNDAMNRSSTPLASSELGGRTLTAGVYNSATSLIVTGALTLDGQGDSAGVFIFQTGGTLTTASASSILLINNANPCNVFWHIGSSATLGTNSTFAGTILASASISATTNATVNGRLLASSGAVTLGSNMISLPVCTAGTTTTTAGGATTTSTGGATTTTNVGATTTSLAGAPTTTLAPGTNTTAAPSTPTTTTPAGTVGTGTGPTANAVGAGLLVASKPRRPHAASRR